MESAKPVGRMIDAGQITLAGNTTIATDTEKVGLRQMSQYSVEGFAPLVSLFPPPMGAIILRLARAGMRRGQGRGRGFMSEKDKVAHATARKEAPELYQKYLAEAKAAGTHPHPYSWARERAAEDLRRRLIELGVATPPSIASIKKWKMRS